MTGRTRALLLMMTASVFCEAAFCQSAVAIRNVDLNRVVSSKDRSTEDRPRLSVLRTAYGDVNLDGQEDAALLVRRQTSSSNVQDEIWICEMNGNAPKIITKLSVGRDGEYALSIDSLGSNFRLDKGTLVFDRAVITSKTQPPSKYQTVSFRWNGKALVRYKVFSVLSLPEHMREIG
mgnify:CR=1 FL=1